MLNLDSLKSVFQREKKEEGQTIEGARIVEVELRKLEGWLPRNIDDFKQWVTFYVIFYFLHYRCHFLDMKMETQCAYSVGGKAQI